jgi:hypothetical protein
MDYLQLVLLPEACLSLIAMDQGLELENDYAAAKTILKESSEFGLTVHDSILDDDTNVNYQEI